MLLSILLGGNLIQHFFLKSKVALFNLANFYYACVKVGRNLINNIGQSDVKKLKTLLRMQIKKSNKISVLGLFQN